MSERWLITPAVLDALFASLAGGGARVVGPREREGRVEIAALTSPAELASGRVQAAGSAKGAVFPRVERILGYRTEGKDVALEDPPADHPPTVVFGIRPCEARAFAALDALFEGEVSDEAYAARRERTTIVAIACTQADAACFCTALGSGPADPSGSDVLLHGLASGDYVAEVLTDEGRALLAPVAVRLCPAGAENVPVATAPVPKAFDGVALGVALARAFDAGIWAEQSLRCLGCGACAFVCPTCACFDIQDEALPGGGRRLRCWDSCGLRQFTLHASGHNPRERQSQRWRQRVYHKFAYYPERLGMLGCVGCGKCSRACPVDMNLKEHLAEVVGISS